jgi:uncharacterized protein
VTNLNNGFVSNRVLKLNVGFLLRETAGYSRDFSLDLPHVRLADDLELSYLRGALRLSRTARGVLVQGDVAVGCQTECARCLKSFLLRLDLEIEDLYVYPPTPGAELAVGENGTLDLAPLLREETIVHTPIGAVCRPECRGLCPICGQNLNDGECECVRDATDPRLAVLRTLQENDRAPSATQGGEARG